MRRIVIWLAATVTVVVLLFGYHTSTNSAADVSPAPSQSAPSSTSSGSSGSPAPSASTSSPSSSGASSPEPSPSTSASSSPSSPSAAKSYTGDVAQTRWGPMQVRITVEDGKITKVEVPQYPDGNPRDAEINANALPELVSETLDAQSAKIDMVSGATVTSDGYLQSLQSALDAAGI